MIRVFICLIKVYQFFSRLFPRCCRFFPTCSEYTRDALEKYGLLRGSFLAAKRILRCHPLNPGGYDPLR